MKAKVPFHYQIDYKGERQVKARHAYFAAEAEIEFREVERAEVRTVMRAAKMPNERERDWHFADPLTAPAGGGLREIVLFEGDLWIEAVPAADTVAKLETRGGEGTPFLPRYSGTRLLQDTTNPDVHKRTIIYSTESEIEALCFRSERARLKTFHDDGGERTRADLQRTAEAFIAIDGMLYARFREPLLRIGGRYSEKSVEFCGTRYGSLYGSGPKCAELDRSVFEEEQAMTWSLTEEAVGRAEWLRANGEEVVPNVRFEVLDPDVLTACPHVGVFLYLATSALGQLWANPLALRHGVLEAAVELRDALADCGSQITPRLRRAVEDVAAIAPLPAEDAELWSRRAAGRPQMKTHHGHYHHGDRTPLTRASQIVAHADVHMAAAATAARALRRLEMRNPRLSWEERALEVHALEGRTAEGLKIVSYELLSAQAVAKHARALDVRPDAAIRVARDENVRIFAVGAGRDARQPALMALVDEEPDGTLSIRSLLHGGEPPDPAAIELLDRHLVAAAPAPEPSLSPGM